VPTLKVISEGHVTACHFAEKIFSGKAATA
jgi:hypothetical protein